MSDILSALDAAIAARKADDESEFYDFGAANRMSVQLVRDYGPALRRALECEAALRELVACKDLKARAAELHAMRPWPPEADNATFEYGRRKPLAWAAASAALSAAPKEK